MSRMWYMFSTARLSSMPCSVVFMAISSFSEPRFDFAPATAQLWPGVDFGCRPASCTPTSPGFCAPFSAPPAPFP